MQCQLRKPSSMQVSAVTRDTCTTLYMFNHGNNTIEKCNYFPNWTFFTTHAHKRVSMTIGDCVGRNKILVDGVLPGRCGATEEKCFMIDYSNAVRRG